MNLIRKSTAYVCRLADQYPSGALLAFSLVYFPGATWLAAVRPMWADEFFTLYIARSASIRGVFDAILTGADQHPPSFYLFSRALFPLLDANQLSVRLPSVLGYWLMSLCLYALVSRRTTPSVGLIALSFPLTTAAYDYAIEGRGYALIMGFGSLALLCWVVATEDGPRRNVALGGLAFASAAAVAAHYYAAFFLLGIAGGEVARTVARGRVDTKVWASLSTSLLPIAVFLPHIRSAAGWAQNFWARPTWQDAPRFYSFLLDPASLAIVLVLMVIVVSALLSTTPRRPVPMDRFSPFHWWELVAICLIVALPFLEVSAAQLLHGGFAPRYALPSVIGVAILVALLIPAMASHMPSAVGGVLVVLGGVFVCRQFTEAGRASATAVYLGRTSAWILASGAHDLPIATWHSQGFLQLGYYGNPAITSRIVYLADPEIALRVNKHDTVDRGFLALRPWFPNGIREYKAFIREHREFLAYGYTGDIAQTGRPWNWLLGALTRDNATVRLLASAGDEMLFLVAFPDANEGDVTE